MKKELITTKEGSHTFYIPELDEYYHSWFGAIAESQHVYMEQGLKYVAQSKKDISILEIGFGTGLNAILTYLELCKNLNWKIDYAALEPDPITMEEFEALNYADILDLSKEGREVYRWMHELSPSSCDLLAGSTHDLVDMDPEIKSRGDSGMLGEDRIQKSIIARRSEASPTKVVDCHVGLPALLAMTFQKFQKSLLDVHLKPNTYDLIYFDAFAPSVQPELWTVAVFRKLFNTLKEGGVLVTYSSKGTVKQALRDVGFKLKRIQGSPRKHHMLRASKLY
jgi:tRNA U34 5-methylaminomethyl-2-thiouridine-forming methyltransferase MnmC